MKERAREGKIGLCCHTHRFDVRALLNEVGSTGALLAKGKELAFATECDHGSDDARTIGRAKDLKRILGNLVRISPCVLHR
jgi:signal transduction histidine kinase